MRSGEKPVLTGAQRASMVKLSALRAIDRGASRQSSSPAVGGVLRPSRDSVSRRAWGPALPRSQTSLGSWRFHRPDRRALPPGLIVP